MKTNDYLKTTIAVLLSLAPLSILAAPGDVIRISENGGTSGNNYSYTDWWNVSHISANGCYAAFHSYATNLDSADTDTRKDVYAYDCNADTVELISRQSAVDGGAKAGAKNNDPTWGNLWASQEPSISGDGRYVAFWSTANNLSSIDTDYGYDVYVYDRDTDTVELVSRKSASAGGAKANSYSLRPSISADGRFVAFMSGATNLDSADTNANYDVYVYDRDTDTVELVSRKSAAEGGIVANFASFNPSISADGRYIAFWTQATNLDIADTDATPDVYVYDRDTDTVELISRQSASVGGTKANNGSQHPSISANGRYVAFESRATNLDSADANPLDTTPDVYVYDRDTDTVELISRQSGGGVKGNSVSAWASINADGRYVAFSSAASNLISGQPTYVPHIYVYDRKTRIQHLVSENANGVDGNNSSYYPSISADGTRVLFTSYATNLVNNTIVPQFYTQVFIKETGLPASGLNQPPVADAGPDQTVEATSIEGASITLNGTNSSDPDGNDDIVSYAWSGPFGTASGVSPTVTLPLGTHISTLTVTDGHGETDTDTVSITVRDTTLPLLNLPADITIEATSPSGAVVTFLATASDAVDSSVTVNCTPSSGAAFALGTTTVSCSVQDDSDNNASGSFTVTVRDTTPPTLSLPADITAEATSPVGAVVNFTVSASDLVSGSVPVSCSPPRSSTFPLGSTSVSCSATDGAGNTANGSFNVTVVDTTRPSLSCPANVTGIVGQAVNLGSLTVSDIADASPSVSNNAPAGYSPGNTLITWTATDGSGNSASCTQTVNLNYNFQGFFQPVDNQPVVNTVKNGSVVPVKWRLLDALGNHIIDTTTVTESKYVASTCGGTEDAVEETVATGGTGLRWDSTAQQFIYNWKTPSLAGKCIRLDIKFNDGTIKSVNFKLK